MTDEYHPLFWAGETLSTDNEAKGGGGAAAHLTAHSLHSVIHRDCVFVCVIDNPFRVELEQSYS